MRKRWKLLHSNWRDMLQFGESSSWLLEHDWEIQKPQCVKWWRRNREKSSYSKAIAMSYVRLYNIYMTRDSSLMVSSTRRSSIFWNGKYKIQRHQFCHNCSNSVSHGNIKQRKLQCSTVQANNQHDLIPTSHKARSERSWRCNKCLRYGHTGCNCPIVCTSTWLNYHWMSSKKW